MIDFCAIPAHILSQCEITIRVKLKAIKLTLLPKFIKWLYKEVVWDWDTNTIEFYRNKYYNMKERYYDPKIYWRHYLTLDELQYSDADERVLYKIPD